MSDILLRVNQQCKNYKLATNVAGVSLFSQTSLSGNSSFNEDSASAVRLVSQSHDNTVNRSATNTPRMLVL